MLEPMQIDSSKFKKLLQMEKDAIKTLFYCSRENHQAQDCSIKASALKLHKVTKSFNKYLVKGGGC
jgi:hypothetical protein